MLHDLLSHTTYRLLHCHGSLQRLKQNSLVKGTAHCLNSNYRQSTSIKDEEQVDVFQISMCGLKTKVYILIKQKGLVSWSDSNAATGGFSLGMYSLTDFPRPLQCAVFLSKSCMCSCTPHALLQKDRSFLTNLATDSKKSTMKFSSRLKMTDAHSQVLSRDIIWVYKTAAEVTQQAYLKGLNMPIDLLGCIITDHSPNWSVPFPAAFCL